MADYYPLIARALEGLPDASPEAREAIYDRARTALLSQLGAIQPPLSEQALATERASLDDAIERAERNFAPAAAVSMPAFELRPPSLDSDDERPPIRRGRRRGRSLLTAIGLVVVIAPIAALAWLWRDKAETPSPPARPAAPAPAPGAPADDPKRPERVGGEPAPGPSRPSGPPSTPGPTAGGDPPAAPARPAPAPAGPAPAGPPAGPEVAVAQRAALVEENTAEPQQSKVTAGRVVWRLDAVNAGQGQPLDTVVRATIDLGDAGMSVALTIRRNADTTLPSSHLIELVFVSGGSDPTRVVTDVNMPLVRPDDTSRGIPLAGLASPVKENLFLLLLSGLRADVDRNTELLLRRNWIEIPLKFRSGLRATVVFEKGVAGDRVMADAFKAWTQP